ncbi:HAD family hydrolase [Paenibacillus sacheonensis]|uniref:Haloacid dehalogenase n=1 Tax=Paenibacillus sacheonensis TaxID=742054 RepID=A0A7X4YSH3_9BACL|nr:haloacid dehalogenase [Paenibacillus sacheonensis]MBM7569267.1 putative hydrolase of the HAD superfamily [Paenibacillus sacheonensis]NBC71723.1 haloacid dehalogenase [Paenibacillus sacheonensis]
MNRKQLVLDVGGVILSNLDSFWERIAEAAGKSYDEIRDAYAAEIREGLWSGTLPEAEFWKWLQACCPSVTAGEARELLRGQMQPLPAVRCIPAWSRLADIHILSNHRAEWLAPCLEPIRSYLGHVVVSSEAGASKPGRAIFERLHRLLDPAAPILYVDDHSKNLAVGEQFGWQSLLADEAGAWIEQVNERLLTE